MSRPLHLTCGIAVLVVSVLTAVADIGTVIYEVHLQWLTLAAIFVIGAIGAMVILSFVGGYLLIANARESN
jgi:cytochrome c biogenesis protein CcdA